MSEPPEAKRPMTLSEAGRKGGEKVKRERGTDFYAEIGRKGGRRVAQDHGPAFYSEIGRKGGEARKAEPREPVERDPDG
ncbi:MAG TPA: KGG domain-containing protein [Candidatus Thermoplasmatota archaeon]|nr:KGG domain-containing protein [Candidatus Thermoplasmatota archaeon]